MTAAPFWFYWPKFGTDIGVAITGIVILGSADCSVPNGSTGKSTSISAVEAMSQDPNDDLASKGTALNMLSRRTRNRSATGK